MRCGIRQLVALCEQGIDTGGKSKEEDGGGSLGSSFIDVEGLGTIFCLTCGANARLGSSMVTPASTSS